MPQSFNDTALENAQVPRTGGEDMPAGNATPSGSGADAGGTGNFRETTTTKQAGNNGTPSGGKNQCPAQSFEDGEVK